MEKIKLLEYLNDELTHEPQPLLPIFSKFQFKEYELELILNSLLRDGLITVNSIEYDSYNAKQCYLIWKTINFDQIANQFIKLKKDFLKLSEEIESIKSSFNHRYTFDEVVATNQKHVNLIEDFQNLKEAIRGMLSNLAEYYNCTFKEIYEKFDISPSD